MKRAGFVRVKIDGKLHELGEEPALNKNQRHTIEVMVDRLAIRKGIEKRLSDSLEVAFKYGQDLLKVERLEGPKNESAIYFSQRFACVDCGISYPEIEPRMFSFNSPHGACTECSGIGSIMYFDPELIVQNEDLSIADGAIAPWATMNYLQPVLDALAKHYKFSLDQPWKEIPLKTRKAIMNGSGSEEIEFAYQRGHHRAEYSKTFEGVRPMARSPLQGDRVRRRARVPRGLHEHAPVPDLRRRAAQEGKPVRALQQQIDFGSDRDVDQAGARVLRRAQAERAGSRNRTAHSERNSRAPQFSRRRRPRVPHPRSPVRQSLRRRGPAHPSRHPNRLEPRRRALHPRRAVDRTPSARQSAPARHPQAPQGTRQHRAGGRARSRDHARSRSSDRHGPRRRHSRRLHRLAGHARRGHARRQLAHRQISFGRRSRFRCRRDAASSPADG